MAESLIERIKAYAPSHSKSLIAAKASDKAIKTAEHLLGFPIPAILRDCYRKVGNGGFGPGYGVIGVEGGYKSDFGNLVETYNLLKKDQESEKRKWPIGLLPFCEWGCNIFSCVDCRKDQHPIYTFENFAAHPASYNLDKFFELWLSGVSILTYDPVETEKVEITNPFTGKKTTVSRRRPR